jgi:hypothetical protein
MPQTLGQSCRLGTHLWLVPEAFADSSTGKQKVLGTSGSRKPPLQERAALDSCSIRYLLTSRTVPVDPRLFNRFLEIFFGIMGRAGAKKLRIS